MTTPIYIKRCNAPRIDEKEILRYAGVAGESEQLLPLLRDCILQISDKLSYNVCYRELSTEQLAAAVSVGREELLLRLADCERVVVLAATVGIELDRQIARYAAVSQTKALLLSSIGTERVESLCDSFCEHVRADAVKRGFRALPRFSAGYGRLPLELQRDIFALLDCPRKIGVTLNGSLLMSPSKSVTAFIGLSANIGE